MGIFSRKLEKTKDKVLLKKIKAYIKEKNSADTFTKRWVDLILKNAVVWVYLSYILAFMDKDMIAEQLSITVVKVIIYTFIPYLGKALFENVFKYGKFNFFKPKEIETDIEDESSVDETSNEADSTVMAETTDEEDIVAAG